MTGTDLATQLLAAQIQFAPVVVFADGKWRDVIGIERKDYAADYYVAIALVLGPPRGDLDKVIPAPADK